ncbi:MAG: AMP-binding protein [Candidatus Lokiarchaeota archaeon]|nr:AMP-binding protein [Candidatus Lokiarchaeota archaeon]
MSSEKLWYKSWPKGIKKTLEYPNISVHKMFENIVSKNSDINYLSILGINFTFGQVNDYADRLASALKELGVKKGDNVGIFMINIPQFVISFFGILKTGATVVPISPLYGSTDLQTTLKDSNLKAIICLDILYKKIQEAWDEPIPWKIITTSLGSILPTFKRILARLFRKIPASPKIDNALDMFKLMEEYERIEKSAQCDPENDVAVIGYTGGTTGTPKGAMITHQNLISNLLAAREWSKHIHPKGTHKNFVGAVPFFHIIGLSAVMLVGAFYESTIHLIPDPRNFESILKAIEKNKIEYCHGVPTLYRALLMQPNFDDFDLTSLEIVFSGAAALPNFVFRAFEEKTGCLMIEAYGMTETSPIVTANPFEKDNRKMGSIGIPFPNTDVKIINPDNGDVLPIGEVGEIIIKGPQVMKGYYQKPEETAHIIRDGYLYSGDLGYMDEDGFIFLVNRAKDMINVSGYKVFPSELEGIITSNFPDIEEAAVVGVHDDYSGEAVKLIAVLKPGVADIKKEEFMKTLKKKVANYKVPKIVEIRDSLPKTALGKIDRRALRAEPVELDVDEDEKKKRSRLI